MNLTLTVGITAFVFSLVLTPLVRDTFRHLGFLDRPDRARKHHSTAVPRVGGIAIALAYVASFAVILLAPFHSREVVVSVLPDVWKLAPAAGLVFLTGLLDDLLGLRPVQKLVGQVAAAGLACWAGVHVRLFAQQPWEQLWNIPLTILWLVACTNAFNLIDGVDGLAAGVGLFATVTMLLAALTHNSVELALVTMPLAGCLLGFLRYNFNPASVFLGDCGSLLIGFLLGCFGALWSEKSATMLGMTAPLMALSIPLLDISLSVARRFLRHQPIFGADRRHIHHRLLDLGLNARRAVVLIYGACGVAATFSLLQNLTYNQFGGLIIVLFCGAAWIGIQNLGYTEFGVARQLLSNRTLRCIIDSQTRLREFERTLAEAGTLERCWETLVAGSREFGFESVRLNAGGRVLETEITPATANTWWQLRIALPGSHYVDFRHSMQSEPNPLTVESFVSVVAGALKTKLGELSTAAPRPSAPQRAEAGENGKSGGYPRATQIAVLGNSSQAAIS